MLSDFCPVNFSIPVDTLLTCPPVLLDSTPQRESVGETGRSKPDCVVSFIFSNSNILPLRASPGLWLFWRSGNYEMTYIVSGGALNSTHSLTRSGNGVGYISKVKLRRARLVLRLVTTLGGSAIPVYIHPGPLSLAIPLCAGAVSTGDGFGHRWGRNGES